MRTIADHHTAVVGLAAVALITVGCSNGKNVDTSAPPQVAANATTTSQISAQPTELKLVGEDHVEVTLPVRSLPSTCRQPRIRGRLSASH